MIDRTALLEKRDDALVVGDVGSNPCRANFFRRYGNTLCVARGNEDFGALRLGQFGRCKTDPGGTSNNDDFFSCKHSAVIPGFYRRRTKPRRARHNNIAMDFTGRNGVRIARQARLALLGTANVDQIP
jgi:hypothetical protein